MRNFNYFHELMSKKWLWKTLVSAAAWLGTTGQKQYAHRPFEAESPHLRAFDAGMRIEVTDAPSCQGGNDRVRRACELLTWSLYQADRPSHISETLSNQTSLLSTFRQQQCCSSWVGILTLSLLVSNYQDIPCGALFYANILSGVESEPQLNLLISHIRSY